MNLDLHAPFKGKLLAHTMGWFGEPNHTHRMTRYVSNDPYVIAHQLDLMQAVGIDGVVVTWQGPTVNPFLHSTATQMSFECSERGMLFGLLLDPWICKNSTDKNAAVTAALADATTQKMIQAPSYLPEKYILDFDTGQTMIASGGATILKRHVDFSWPEITNTITQAKTDNAKTTMKIPGICLGFNDGGFLKTDGTRDYGHSIWDVTVPTRNIDHQAGGTYWDLASTIQTSTPYVAIVSWNDHDEGTGIEQFASILAGQRI